MIGNKNGWLIAAAIACAALLLSLIIVMQSAFAAGSKPTTATLVSGVLDEWNTSEPIDGFIDSPPIGEGNAGDDYARAVRVLRDNAETIRRFHGGFRSWKSDAQEVNYKLSGEPKEVRMAGIREVSFDQPPAVAEVLRHVAEGAGKETMKYVFVHTAREDGLRVDRRIEASNDFIAIAKVLMAVTEYHYHRGEFQQSLGPQENMLVMGRHMFNERAHVDMMYQGLIIQNDALQTLIPTYEDLGYEDKTDRARSYRRSVRQLMDRIEKKLDVIMPPADENRLANPGDVFNIARNDKDRAWRVQGVLALGILKVQPQGVMVRGDERVTRKLIEKFLDSPEPLIRAAAQAARDLTLSDDLKEIEQPFAEALGQSNRGVRKLTSVEYNSDTKQLTVVFALDDNLTKEYIRLGGMNDVKRVMEGAHKTTFNWDELIVQGTFTLADQYGNEAELVVLEAKFDRDEIRKIKWGNFRPERIPEVAKTFAVHVELE